MGDNCVRIEFKNIVIDLDAIWSVITTPLGMTFVIYILGMIMIGFVAYRSIKNFDDYILGGRRIGSFVTALSAGASDMSGWLLMGLPGAIFISGLSQSWIAIGLVIGAYLNWKLVAGRLRVHTEVNDNALTLPDYLSSRFEDKSRVLRIISAVVILVFFTIYCASGVVAGARLFESTFDMNYETALWVGAAATILYTFVGGFLAVSWTDTVQASLMVFALILTPVMVILAVGGVDSSLMVIKAQNATNVNMFEGLSGVAIISAIGWGLGYFGQPHILARFMAAESHHSIHKARRISMTWMIFCLSGAVAVGFFGIAYFAENPYRAGEVSANSERIFIELTKYLFNPWIAGVLLSAILAAVMSTLSCQLLVCSSALTEDLYKAFFRKRALQIELVWVGRLMVLLVAVIAIVLAYNPNNKVLDLVSNAWAGFGAAFGPVILISLLWPRMTRNGALAGMIVGSATVLIWMHFKWLLLWIHNKFIYLLTDVEWWKLYEIIPGFILASIAIVLVSLVGRGPSKNVISRFQDADAEYKGVAN